MNVKFLVFRKPDGDCVLIGGTLDGEVMTETMAREMIGDELLEGVTVFHGIVEVPEKSPVLQARLIGQTRYGFLEETPLPGESLTFAKDYTSTMDRLNGPQKESVVEGEVAEDGGDISGEGT